MAPEVVVDTNVLVAALRSRRGASHKLLQLVGTDKFNIHVSVPLVLEYESVAKRLVGETTVTAQAVDDVIDYLCSMAGRWKIYYLWRPFLRDSREDMVLELAVAAGASRIVTFNTADFSGAEKFGIELRTPKEFLKEIGEIP
jgi:putative PIN family toxin of toxin-antitoxin system